MVNWPCLEFRVARSQPSRKNLARRTEARLNHLPVVLAVFPLPKFRTRVLASCASGESSQTNVFRGLGCSPPTARIQPGPLLFLSLASRPSCPLTFRAFSPTFKS